MGKSKLPLLLLLIVFSCKRNSTESVDDASFRLYNLETQGWKSKVSSQNIDDIKFTATEVPIQYYILKEMGNDDLLAIDSVYNQNKRERVIEVMFEQDDEKDLLAETYTKLDYTSAVKYLSFNIEKDFYAVTSTDTIACSGVTFERNFKVGPYQKILLFFTDVPPDEKLQLVYTDNLFNKGTIKFKFNQPIIKL